MGKLADSVSTGSPWQGEAGRIFAVKVLQTRSAESVRDFRREALLLGRVDHPGIIKMYHYGKIPQPFMVSILSVWDLHSYFRWLTSTRQPVHYLFTTLTSHS